MAVAGANIANAAGRPDAGSPYNPWTARVIQDPIGAYVEAPTETKFAAATNYIGYSSNTKYDTNVTGQGSVAVGPTIAPQPDWQVPNNDNDALGTAANGAQWVRAAGTIAANAHLHGDRWRGNRWRWHVRVQRTRWSRRRRLLLGQRHG